MLRIAIIPIIKSKAITLINFILFNGIIKDITLEIKIETKEIKKFIEIGLIIFEKSNFNIDLKSLVSPQVLHEILKFSL